MWNYHFHTTWQAELLKMNRYGYGHFTAKSVNVGAGCSLSTAHIIASCRKVASLHHQASYRPQAVPNGVTKQHFKGMLYRVCLNPGCIGRHKHMHCAHTTCTHMTHTCVQTDTHVHSHTHFLPLPSGCNRPSCGRVGSPSAAAKGEWRHVIQEQSVLWSNRRVPD